MPSTILRRLSPVPRPGICDAGDSFPGEGGRSEPCFRLAGIRNPLPRMIPRTPA